MKLPVILGLVILLSSCAETSKTKVNSEGYYYFNNEPISVWAPDRCLLDMFVFDDDRHVDFVTGRGYWMESGIYAVQVYNIPPEITDRDSFIESTEKFFQDYLVKDRASFVENLKIKEAGGTEVNGRPAYKGISTDSSKAVFAAVSQLHENRITVASLLYPLKKAQEPEKQIPWQCFNRFVESVSEIK